MTSKTLDALAARTVDTIKRTLAPRDERLAALEQRLAEFEQRPLLKDAGLWRHGAAYTLGDVVQFKGSPWICTKAHTATGTPDHSSFRLWLKTGKDQR